MARERVLQSGAKFGPYDVISHSGSLWSVACRNCGTERRISEKSLRMADSLKATTCNSCAKTGKPATPAAALKMLSSRVNSIERTLARQSEAIDDLGQRRLVERICELQTRLHLIEQRCTEVRSKEVIFTEIFAFLGYMSAAGNLPAPEYLKRLGLMMQLVEAVPAAWFHARRYRKLAEWVDFLTTDQVLAAIKGCETDPVPAEGEEDED